MNEFLRPVLDVLTSEWQPFPALKAAVDAKISGGEMDAGCYASCDYAWFEELVASGHAEKRTEAIFGAADTPHGFRAFFRAAQA